MKTTHIIPALALMTTLLSACNMPARPTSPPIVDLAAAGTIAAQTLEALTTATPPTGTPVILMATATQGPTATPPAPSTTTATITPTYAVPMLFFDDNVNCRQGPGTAFQVVMVIQQGEQLEVSGEQDTYWIVKVPDSDATCWLPKEFATPSGSTWSIPTVSAPEVPTSEPPAAPNWVKYYYSCEYAAGGNNLTMEMIWSDWANDETGYRVMRNGATVVTLPPDSTAYTDVTFLESGKTLDYYIEVFNADGKSQSSTINASCQ